MPAPLTDLFAKRGEAAAGTSHREEQQKRKKRKNQFCEIGDSVKS